MKKITVVLAMLLVSCEASSAEEKSKSFDDSLVVTKLREIDNTGCYLYWVATTPGSWMSGAVVVCPNRCETAKAPVETPAFGNFQLKLGQ